MKVRIISLGKKDAFYPDRKELIGKVGYFDEQYKGSHWSGGHFASTKKLLNSGDFFHDDFYCFAFVKVEEVK